MTTTIIKGRGKGGSNQTRTPVEAPDSIQSIATAKVLIALGEGEFAGGLDGKNIFLGDSSSYTPLQNADGSYNFNNVKYEFRSGTQDQDYIQGFPGIENELQVSYELKQAVPYVRAVSNTQLSALRIRLGWPTLLLQKNNGDKVGTRVEYAIDLSVDGGPYETVVNGAVDDKTTSLYERSHRVNLPKASTGWQLRVRRITPDSTSVNIVDTMRVVAVTEIIDAKLRYVNTALLYVEFDAKQFPNGIPQVVCNPKGRIIRVPDTYDPETRTYSGTWEGVFKWAWTDNPAWIYYDIILNERFGLGQRIDATQIDKWELYRIAQYCDQLVPDGKGGSGTEPRFRCNVYIQDRNDAWTVLRDLAGIFRGMTYWGDNKMYVLADMPRDVWHIYNHASVVEGKFTFADPSETTRNTAALVNWSDPANHYKDTPEPVYDNDLAMRFDYRQLEMTAIGCTRQSEANRRGRWALLTNGIGEVVTFSTGMDVPPVGEVIGVAANELAGRTIGGRVSAVNGRNITLDRAADVKAGNRLFLNLPSGTAQARTVQAVNGNTVTVTTPYSETPEAECNWGVDSDDLFIALFRVTGTRDNNDGTFEVTGTTYNPDIYSAVDTGARLDERPVSVIPPGVQAPPGNIVVDSYSTVNQNIAITTMRVAWDSVQGAVAYEAEWRRDSGNWISVPRTSSLGFEVQGIYSGRYLVRVRAVNASDVSSVWETSSEVNLTGKVGNPPKPVGFIASDNVVFGIELSWGFPANTDDTLKTEIQYSLTGTEDDAMLLADVPYPQRKYQQMGLKAGQIFWYRAQLVDRSGNESGYTEWVRGQASIDVSDITDAILEDMKGSDTFKDLIENAVDSNEKIAGMADDIKQANDELEQQAKDIAKNAQDVGKVQTSVNELSSTVGEVSSSLSELEQTVATADIALGQRIDSISVSMDGMTGGVKNSAIAIIQNGLAQVAARKTLSASVAGNSASLDRIDEVIVNDREATARSLLSLQTSVNGNTASINSLSQTVSNYQQATATQINGITATINGHTSAITTNAQAIANVNGDLKAMYSIKVGVSSNGQYYAAGMGIGVENTPGGMQSQVVFIADRFAVTSMAGGTLTLPFVIQNGQTIIRDTVIGDGTISNTKIGNYIQSTTWDGTGNVGWHINKSGYAVFNNVTVRGMVYASGGKFTGTIEATSFVGDVANVGVGSDALLSGTANLVKTITYTDSGASSLSKNAIVEATFYSSANADTRMNVIIDINGTSKTFSNLPVQSGAYANNFYTLRFGVKGINASTVTATLTIVNANSVSKVIYSPSLTITRGTGSFVG
ncbi:phage tail protein [Enterobacter asburiae]|uniref:host specificity protein J n=3 Tax=Enterobacter cloacae complex TaxID=354276 RepID=UPI001F22CD56|nr:phage tail protein [Enterobacter asburiae]MCF1340067.1 phage tail protein [Enterobacter asburiae]MCQ4338448.1 phage tail protein [Enterobacter asburiae]HDC4531191.1 phage tail protein [Enterobacter asburiae]